MKYKLRQDGVKEVSFNLQLFWFSYAIDLYSCKAVCQHSLFCVHNTVFSILA